MPSSSSPSQQFTHTPGGPSWNTEPALVRLRKPFFPGTWRACASTRPSHPASVVWLGSQECESGAARPSPQHKPRPRRARLRNLSAGGQQPVGSKEVPTLNPTAVHFQGHLSYWLAYRVLFQEPGHVCHSFLWLFFVTRDGMVPLLSSQGE